MIRVEGPPINANIGTKLERLHKPLRTVVTSLAERLERAEPELQRPAHSPFFGQLAKCEVAHTSLPIRPSKVRHSDIYLAPGGVHRTETKTS